MFLDCFHALTVRAQALDVAEAADEISVRTPMPNVLALAFLGNGAGNIYHLLRFPGGQLMTALPDIPHRSPTGFQDMATAPESIVV